MWTVAWLIFTTFVGGMIGHVGYDGKAVLGAIIGFFVGALIRYLPSILEDIGDIFT